MKNKLLILLMIAVIFPVNVFAWQGMPTPMLHVEGRYLKNPNGENVTLRGGWMQPTETWFSGQGRWYSNPSDWTNPNDVAGMLNFLNGIADLMSDTSPRYGKDHGWYASFVRVNTDAIGGWTQERGLVDRTQFNAWIENFIVPYAKHLKSRGLYLILSATGPVNTPNNGSRNAGRTEQERLRTFWTTVANAPGVKNADNIMFELMNEPVDIESSPGNGDWGHAQAKYYSAFRDWIQPVINDIQDTGANNVIWVPTLEWQGSPQQHAEFPFTCTNCGVAAHYYPAYGGCYDNADCHNRLWNRNYKPATDKWPMIITENFWFPEDNGLSSGSTAHYGNTLKANMDKEGNVSYMIGFIGDLLDSLNNARPEDANLSSKEGAQAAFEWWYQSNSQSNSPSNSPSDSCTPTTITPYVQVDDGDWQQTASVTVDADAKVKFGPQPISDASWSWSGGGTSSTTREQTIYPASSVTATATYTNNCGEQSTQNFTVNINQDSHPNSVPNPNPNPVPNPNPNPVPNPNPNPVPNPNPNPTPTAQAIENGRYNIVSSSSGLYLDVYGARMDDGTNVIQYPGNGRANQQFDVEALGDGTYSIRAAHSGKAVEVSEGSANDGAELRQGSYTGGQNQRWHIKEVGNGVYSITSALSDKAIDVWEMNTKAGGEVKLYGWWGGSNQQWSFVKVGDAQNPNPVPNPNPNPVPNPNPNPVPNPNPNPVPGDVISSAGCGKNATLTSGEHTIRVNGQNRSFIVRVPDDYDSSHPYPLVFAFHWYGGTMQDVDGGGSSGYTWSYYGLREKADNSADHKMIFVAPQGLNNGWANSGGQDLSFVDDMTAQIEESLCVDKSRLFSLGFSYGGGMTYAIACDRADVFRGAAVYAGGQISGCSDGSKPIAYIGIHGIDDRIDGGRAARDTFVVNNSCSPQSPPEPDRGSLTHVCTSYNGCQNDYPVRWCAFDGGGHTPAPVDGTNSAYGGGDATWTKSEVWDFFTQF